MDSNVAEQLALVADSKIVLASNDKVIASTFSPDEEREIQQRIATREFSPGTSRETALDAAQYQVTSVALYQGPPSPVQCYVFIPLDRPMGFIRQLNRTILILGIS